jgi:hypothetical protein
MALGIGTALTGLAVGGKALVKRLAGQKLAAMLGGAAKAVGKRAAAAGVSGPDALRQLGWDAAMSGPFALMGPGDPLEKGTQFIGDVGLSYLGGAGLRTALGRRALNPDGQLSLLGMGAEGIGTAGGYLVGQPLIVEPTQRLIDSARGGRGETPYERLAYEQEAQMRQMVEADLLERLKAQGLLNPGLNNSRMNNPFDLNSYV